MYQEAICPQRVNLPEQPEGAPVDPFANPFTYPQEHGGLPAHYAKFRPNDPHTMSTEYIDMTTSRLFTLAHLMQPIVSEVYLSTWEENGVTAVRLHGTDWLGVHVLLFYEASQMTEEGLKPVCTYYKTQIPVLGFVNRDYRQPAA